MDTISLTIIIIVFFIGYFVGHLVGKKGLSATTPYPGPHQPLTFRPTTVNGLRIKKSELLGQIKNLLQRNQKIYAIKLLREQRNLGLKEAKDYVEAVEIGGPLPFEIGD